MYSVLANMICQPNLVDILCRYSSRPDYPVRGRGSGI
jgi:hypothetical protein